MRRIVSDTGPLISLEKLNGGYDFIRILFDEIIIPPHVLEEVAYDLFESPVLYFHHHKIVDLITVKESHSLPEPFISERLHEAEIQAIRLAHELRLPLLIEETEGRRVAQELGLHISGIAGQALKAFREGLVDKAFTQNLLNELLKFGRINKKIHTALSEEL